MSDEQDTEVPAEDALEGFEEAFKQSGLAGFPSDDDQDTPQDVEVVESEEGETPSDLEPEDSPEDDGESPDSESDTEEKPAPDDLNYEGFSDAQAERWKRLYEAGHVTAEEVEDERHRIGYHKAFIQKTENLAKQRKDLDAWKSERQADLELVDRIRQDDRLNERWNQMREEAQKDVDDDDLLTAKQARELLERERKKERESEQRRQAAEGEHQQALRTAVSDMMRTEGIDEATMKAYLGRIEATMSPEEAANITPYALMRDLGLLHEATKKDVEIEKLKKKLSRKRTSQQSQPPTPKVARDTPETALSKTEKDLGLDANWTQVQGLGHRGSWSE